MIGKLILEEWVSLDGFVDAATEEDAIPALLHIPILAKQFLDQAK